VIASMRDQEHVHVRQNHAPSITSRTAALLVMSTPGRGPPSPLVTAR
jgi:hypothetical protein